MYADYFVILLLINERGFLSFDTLQWIVTFETFDTLQLFSVMGEQDVSSSVCTCTCKQHTDVHVVNTVLTYVMYSI